MLPRWCANAFATVDKCGLSPEGEGDTNLACGSMLGWVRLSNQTPSPEGTPEGFACEAGRVGAAMLRGRVYGAW